MLLHIQSDLGSQKEILIPGFLCGIRIDEIGAFRLIREHDPFLVVHNILLQLGGLNEDVVG